MKIPDKLNDFIWGWKKPCPPVLSDPMLSLGDTELGGLALDMVGESLNSARGSYQSKVHLLPACWRSIYVLHKLDGQVLNGGFHQFFTNSRGLFDINLKEDISYLPDERIRNIILRAFEAYQKIDYRDQWMNIGKSWEYFSAPYAEGRFKTEDDEYYSLSPCISALIGSRIKAHPNEYKGA
jgi:hypothetical protein